MISDLTIIILNFSKFVSSFFPQIFRLLRLLLNFQYGLKGGRGMDKKALFLPTGPKKSLGQSPPPELELGPRGPYHLVYYNTSQFCGQKQFLYLGILLIICYGNVLNVKYGPAWTLAYSAKRGKVRTHLFYSKSFLEVPRVVKYISHVCFSSREYY